VLAAVSARFKLVSFAAFVSARDEIVRKSADALETLDYETL
jgi:hypothetical protein